MTPLTLISVAIALVMLVLIFIFAFLEKKADDGSKKEYAQAVGASILLGLVFTVVALCGPDLKISKCKAVNFFASCGMILLYFNIQIIVGCIAQSVAEKIRH